MIDAGDGTEYIYDESRPSRYTMIPFLTIVLTARAP
jgi:hypothetical protein